MMAWIMASTILYSYSSLLLSIVYCSLVRAFLCYVGETKIRFL